MRRWGAVATAGAAAGTEGTCGAAERRAGAGAVHSAETLALDASDRLAGR